ncbi:NAD(P)H-hydrate dehydratase [Oribacterium sp. FC2011]|uniref:NAD(P)H-hydrate dehydratase n=1 Tax=Oribacterium sp. FC2011 TaxID=1408311 RepID=UPI0004E1323C|nr:NAD(P)H-hydrate dehydratase [Oribacterium sp. FC2011]
MQIVTDASKFYAYIPKRLEDSHKGTYGKVLIVAGSKGMSGAAYLSALAAYRTGAGLVKFLTHKDNRLILQTLLPEAIFEGYDEETDLQEISERNAVWADVMVLGPGMGTTDLSKDMVEEILNAVSDKWGDKAEEKHPLLIIDADGLNIISSMPHLKDKLKSVAEEIPVVITPHPMEMSRLAECEISEVVKNPEYYAETVSGEFGLITVMKGSQTLICDAQHEAMFKNTKESPALSKGGSGDVLSGTIAGLYALMRPSVSLEIALNPMEIAYRAAVAAVLIHAEAGREAALTFGVNGVLARDTADKLGTVLDRIRIE